MSTNATGKSPVTPLADMACYWSDMNLRRPAFHDQLAYYRFVTSRLERRGR